LGKYLKITFIVVCLVAVTFKVYANVVKDEILTTSLIIKMIKYVDGSFKQEKDSVIEFAIYGDFNPEEVQDYKTFDGKKYVKNKVKIYLNPSKESLQRMDIIYVTKHFSKSKKEAAEIISSNKKALTVVDAPYYRQLGSVVELLKYREKLKFRIYKKIAKDKKILFYGKLLELAEEIYD
jgi:hypothetical protein